MTITQGNLDHILHPRNVSPAKRAYSAVSLDVGLSLPVLRPTPVPALKETQSFMFTGRSPLYTRHIVKEKPLMMEIRCGQPGCIAFTPKVIPRILSGTNNYKTHYKKCHPLIPLSTQDVIDQQKQKGGANAVAQDFFSKPISDQSFTERYRILLLEFIIKNNLSFSIVDQPETKALFSFLSPNTKQISRRTLMEDLKQQYHGREQKIHKMLQQHIYEGGRIALTTDGWAGNNKLDYVAVTGHIISKGGKSEALLLNIIKLTNPIHSGIYLCEKLLEVTDRLGITCAIISITRDNASPNNVMVKQFESHVADQWDLMDEFDKLRFCIKFNRTDRDIRCCAHIYNIAVQSGK